MEINTEYENLKVSIRTDRQMNTKFFVTFIIFTLIVGAVYSSFSSDLYALKVKSVRLCEKSTSDGISTETCCQLETDSSTEKTTEYCTECKTASGGEDLGCTHSQTDVSFTINDGKLGIKTVGPKLSTDKLSDDNKVQIPRDLHLKGDRPLTKDNGIATEENQVTTNDGSNNDSDTVNRKELDNQDKLGNFEIQDLMSDYKNNSLD